MPDQDDFLQIEREFTAGTDDVPIACRIALGPKCNDPDCACRSTPPLWLLWVSEPDRNAWVLGGYAGPDEVLGLGHEWPGESAEFYRRMSMLLGIAWDALLRSHAGAVAITFAHMIGEMPDPVLDAIMSTPMHWAEGEHGTSVQVEDLGLVGIVQDMRAALVQASDRGIVPADSEPADARWN